MVFVWKMEQLMVARFEKSESSILALYTVYKFRLQETKCKGFSKVTDAILGVLTVPVASSRDCHPWVQSHQ